MSLQIATAIPMGKVAIGDSIAVNGVCLTVTAKDAQSFVADASIETLKHSSLGEVALGGSVHLERALQVGGRLGGHFVQGHVDGTGRLARRVKAGRAWDLWIDLPAHLLAEVVPKGSIAIDGVSLTVNEVSATGCRLTIIPHTENRTLLIERPVGSTVNVETDVIGKYVRRFLGLEGGDMAGLLKRFGFTAAEEG